MPHLGPYPLPVQCLLLSGYILNLFPLFCLPPSPQLGLFLIYLIFSKPLQALSDFFRSYSPSGFQQRSIT